MSTFDTFQRCVLRIVMSLYKSLSQCPDFAQLIDAFPIKRILPCR